MLLSFGCGKTQNIENATDDNEETKSVSISPEIIIPTAEYIKAKLTNTVSRDARVELEVYTTAFNAVSPETFAADLITKYGETKAFLLVSYIDKTITDLKDIENKLKNTYGVNIFFPKVVFMVDKTFNGIATYDRLKIILSAPSAEEENELLKPILAHEYGHFLSFHNPDGTVAITSAQNAFNIDMNEMSTKGVVDRYHLKNIYFKPYLSKPLTELEYWGMVEIMAQKVMAELSDYKDERALLKWIVNSYSIKSKNLPPGSPPIESAYLYALFFSEKYNLPKYQTIFNNRLLNSKTISGQAQIDASIKKLKYFYNNITISSTP
ncbi:hypothetical protein A2276_00200 [candidate division WOR-1 bacterium RIFOXYA12_FULL_43_27]|uniref:Uncharacterized protein n=1 Tax=candidate division WOR-1 bacterium RIFOXYC2_FULL_46_14 TaxID=1802587 RepID=A0A1F4U4J6_UNCSA|nr:MAG: hypothetical protein A2276_00200 [candidate division WOR-1 bacterium RIFOXYA12_FULL_43_27]OGC20881.1 MAG: hypothetical protein A2292_07675 [candidate division WOR-1 bacterium RIFOXYB2_FULL_46_45]OGC31381.1 MAG: hypothetical protein A2232_03770 [candidate division WOR-1 bacterium RIFOXYA2_FULL_46_56]OGC39787.1 MAG: hypothetical protein A2438_04605 [candidate division WOR-1 bacterium RIFOXYC2_FULL_46_14]